MEGKELVVITGDFTVQYFKSESNWTMVKFMLKGL